MILTVLFPYFVWLARVIFSCIILTTNQYYIIIIGYRPYSLSPTHHANQPFKLVSEMTELGDDINMFWCQMCDLAGLQLFFIRNANQCLLIQTLHLQIFTDLKNDRKCIFFQAEIRGNNRVYYILQWYIYCIIYQIISCFKSNAFRCKLTRRW